MLLSLGLPALVWAQVPTPSANVVGREVYQVYCSSCHGPTGAGDGPLASEMARRPADFTDRARMDALTDEDLFKTIQQGGASVGHGPLMPSWATVLRDEDIRGVVAHIRTLVQE